VSICTTCREKAKAFIRKPENAKPGEVSPAAKLARAAVTVCVLCSVLIVPAEAAEAQAGFPAGYSVMHHASQVIRVPVSDAFRSRREGKRGLRTFCGFARRPTGRGGLHAR
jgi:1-aminocyclopropane-1-carboxylate deaminase/D-cysteine desulfhydrase-like pyridoxal-dependent ACC family enzyme